MHLLVGKTFAMIRNNDYKVEKLFFDTPGEKLHLLIRQVLQLLLENWGVTH